MNNHEPNNSNNRLMKYNWQQKDWPNFQYKTEKIEDSLFDFAQRTGRISGVLDGVCRGLIGLL